MQQVSIELVSPSSPTLSGVIALGDKYKKFLGLLSPDVFSERAERKSILAALFGSTVVGYLMFYRAEKGHIRITHMCVDEPYRRSKIAKTLFSELVNRSGGYQRILLSCRRDFESCSYWPQLGFVFVSSPSNGPGRFMSKISLR